jgi:L,D-peptidoglycan transpeptidase YkuD (ErfK/YbiS/YcfS/YnhG family)
MPYLRHRIRSVSWLCLAAALCFAGCTSHSTHPASPGSPWRDSRQLVLVTIPDWNADHGQLRTYVREGGRWHAAEAAQPVTIGRAGAAWGLGLNATHGDGPIKHEGDGRSAAGVFRIGEAFGYGAHADTGLAYRALQASDYCIDVDGSPRYNRIVDANTVDATGSTEPMRRDLHMNGDQRYRLGFVIEHNADGKRGAGSCIFAHLWQSPTDTTAGCTAMSDATMQHLLAWLKREDAPIFVLLPEREYARSYAGWNLPSPEVQP